MLALPIDSSDDLLTGILNDQSHGSNSSSNSDNESSYAIDSEMKEQIDEEFKGIKKRLDYIEKSESDLCISFSTPQQEMAGQVLGIINWEVQ